MKTVPEVSVWVTACIVSSQNSVQQTIQMEYKEISMTLPRGFQRVILIPTNEKPATIFLLHLLSGLISFFSKSAEKTAEEPCCLKTAPN